MRQRLCLFLGFVLLCGLKCDRGVEPPAPAKVDLTLQSATTTEVWLKLAFPDSPSGGDFTLSRDGNTVSAGHFITADTTLIDDSLVVGKTYTYIASKVENGSSVGSSSPLQVKTMDSTSHNFAWQTFVLGDGNSSILNDVAIINDTLVYAVGEIYKRDSAGQWQNYNVAKWNGIAWELMSLKYNCRLYFPNCGPETLLYVPAHSVYAFGPNDVWIAAGSVHHFDGTQWTQHAGIQGVGSANKIWGSNSNDLWFVGNLGFLAHYNGSSWQKIESGTTLDIQDIWGSNTEIIAVASNPFSGPQRKILAISGSQVSVLSDSAITQPLDGIWFSSGRKYYVVGSGIYYKTSLDELRWSGKPLDFTPYYSHAIRGSEINNVVVVGAFGDVLHYNGSSWKRYTDMELQSFAGQYNAVDIRGNTVAAAGFLNNGQAIALIGKR